MAPTTSILSPSSHFRAQKPLEKSVACLPVKWGRQIEVNFTVDIRQASGEAAASVTLLASPDGRERTLIGCNSTHLIVNQLNSTLTPDLTPEQLTRVKFFWDNAAVANHTILYAPLPQGKSHGGFPLWQPLSHNPSAFLSRRSVSLTVVTAIMQFVHM